jgi:hypothetical protein
VAVVALFFLIALSGTFLQEISPKDPPFTLFIAIPVFWAGQAVVAGFVAREKGRNTVGWVIGVLLGNLCGVVSLIVLVILIFLPYADDHLTVKNGGKPGEVGPTGRRESEPG